MKRFRKTAFQSRVSLRLGFKGLAAETELGGVARISSARGDPSVAIAFISCKVTSSVNLNVKLCECSSLGLKERGTERYRERGGERIWKCYLIYYTIIRLIVIACIHSCYKPLIIHTLYM